VKRSDEMTTIKATCPTCGEVGLTPDDIELRVDESGTEESFYAFDCPACYENVRKPADERVVQLLLSGGVERLVKEPPARAPEPRFPWPALTHDDLLDFHYLLEETDWFGALEAVSDEVDAR
jgi:predicted RNA-binding Zn-ribbon protein involved in translation (DUF1610 family)